jgi:hypothetical protein
MACSRAFSDLHYHVARAAGRLSDIEYEPLDILRALKEFSVEKPNLRHMMAGTMLSSQLELKPQEEDAVFEYLVPEAAKSTCERLVTCHLEYKKRREEVQRRPMEDPQAAAELPSAWIPWDVVTEVTVNTPCVTAAAWYLTSSRLEDIAPKLDPQEWDADPYFIDAAFGIASPDCAVAHDENMYGVQLRPPYIDKSLHEEVSGSVGPIQLRIACDLKVSFKQAFGSPVSNHAIYDLVCNHQGWVARNEGHCYVRDQGENGRLIYIKKHLCFTERAPALLTPLAPVVFPIWLKSLLLGTLA